MRIKHFQITLLFFSLVGDYAMSADVHLIWEWPADRTVQQKVLIKGTDVKKEESGFFGFEKTPSFTGN